MPGRKESTDLFSLIKNLSPEEKSYFRKFSKRHIDKGSLTLKLFDTLTKQSVYDEKLIKKQFSNFPVLKQALFDNIIQSLIISNNKPNGKITFLKTLIEIELLKEKKLFNRAKVLIDKNLIPARNAGQLFFEEELLRMWNFYALAHLDAHGRLKQQNEYEKKYAEFCQRKENMDLMISANAKLFAIDILATTEPDNYPDPDEFVDLKYLENPANALTPMADSARRLNLAMYYSIKQDVEKYYQLSKANFAEVEKQKNIEGKYNEIYIKSLRALIYGALQARRFNETEQLIEKHIQLNAANRWMQEEHLLTTNMMKQYLFWESGRHREGIEFSNNELKRIKYPSLSEDHYVFAHSYFQMKMFFEFSLKDTRALYLSASMLHQIATKGEVETIDKHSELLKILAQTGDENFDLIPGLINNLRRSKAGKKLNTKEVQLLEPLKTINRLNRTPIIKSLHSKFSKKENQINIFGQQDVADILLALQKNEPLSQILAARQID